MTRAQRTILLNQVALSVRSFDEVRHELATINEVDLGEWLTDLIYAVGQSHPTVNDVDQALSVSGLKLTHTPCVLLRSQPIREALAKIRSLPADETEKSFRALTALLGVADRRRRVGCGVRCNHWWHRDLSDAAVVDDLLRSGEI